MICFRRVGGEPTRIIAMDGGKHHEQYISTCSFPHTDIDHLY